MLSDLFLFFFVPLGSAAIFLFVSLHDKFSSKTGLLLDRNMKTTRRKQENTGHVTRRLLSQASSDEEIGGSWGAGCGAG